MKLNLFGFEISKKLKNVEGDIAHNNPTTGKSSQPIASFVPKNAEDGSFNISAGGYFGQYVDIDGTTVASDQDLILKYRGVAEHPECDMAINFITDEAIVNDDSSAPVTLTLDDLQYTDAVKEEIQEEFETILHLLDFNSRANEIFRQWYIDGKLFYHVIINPENASAGIIELRQIDPIKMQKIREVDTVLDSKTGVRVTETKAEYYVFNDRYNAAGGVQSSTIGVGDAISGLKIDPNAICYVTSGLLDASRKRVISNLHKALKPINQLRMMEDSLVIYRISRAPERRIFYVDVGNLPKGKAEEYMQGIMSKYRNKLVYDGQTGEIRDDRRHMSMLEDFWLPRREGGRGTEITTLPGGDNLGQIEDILFFKKNVYRCMNVPLSRLDNDSKFALGRASEISRDEVAFQKFIDRLRKKFSYLFINLLKTQLVLKGIITIEDWDDMSQNIAINFQKDNYFTELKEFEVMKERLSMIDAMGDKIGKYYSTLWVRRNILHQTDEDIATMNKEIATEVSGEAASTDTAQFDLENDLTLGDAAAPAAEGDSPMTEPPAAAAVDEEGESLPSGSEPLPGAIGLQEIQRLIELHGLSPDSFVSDVTGVKYLRVANPLNDKSILVDPDIITLKYFLDQLGIVT